MDSLANPVLSNSATRRFADSEKSTTMTKSGSLIKTAISLFILIAAAIAGWAYFDKIGTGSSTGVLIGLAIITPIIGIVTAFRPSAPLVLLYALLEGFLIGIFSRFFDEAYSGIVVMAVTLTIAITLATFALYALGAIKITDKVRSVILIATFGALVFYLIEFFLSIFLPGFALAVSSGSLGVGIAVIIVIIAALNLLLDFDFITRGSQQGLDKKAEWYAAFGLMVTLIWLYISVLRLLAVSRR